MFCTMDSWIDLSMGAIRQMEDQARDRLTHKINERNDNKTQF